MAGTYHQPQTLTAEDETLKRNTDCVYFLASPLTCKKGAECEYRHSETARVNPRDCYYWLNGNCLNPKCAFRHPPLEGMLGPQVPAPSGPSLTPFQTTATPVSNAPLNSGKQAVPCIFFQKGFCLKGDRCSFSHGQVANNCKAPQGPGPAAAFPEASTIKKSFVGLEKCSREPKVVEAYIPPKPMEVSLQAKPSSRSNPAKNESAIEKHARPASGLDDYSPEYRQTTPPFANGDFISRPNCIQQVHIADDYDPINSKDAEEFSREHSPGFDVLVEDDLRETNYYHEEDQYERTRGNEGRRWTPVNDYDIDHSVNYKDYDSMVDVNPDIYRDQRRYDSFDRTRGQYDKDQQRVSSERISGSSERRRYPRGDSPDLIDGSDLRYRLSQHKKVNGLRSVISHDLDRDGGGQSYLGSSRRDTHNLPSSERGLSDRLRGRIKLPGRSTSPLNERDLHRGREGEREGGNSMRSPRRSQGYGHQGGGVQDRIKRMHEDFDDEGRGFRGPRAREMYGNNVNFAAPKSLSELRGRKYDEDNKQLKSDYQQAFPLGKRKYSESYQQSENDVSFEGPKPLSEILKRKRGADGKGDDSIGRSNAGKEVGEDSQSADGRTPKTNASNFETEEGLIVEDGVEDQEHDEAYAEVVGDYEYEQTEGEYCNEDEAENTEEGGEYVEDDDGDDFAKKIGVVFS